jgi:exonuclease III
MIAAKESFTSTSVTPTGDDGGELIQAAWQDGLVMVGAYFPQLTAKRPFFDRCKKLARQFSNRPFLLIGDINTGSNEVDLQEGASPFACAKDFEELSTHAGLSDLWRSQHGPDERAFTWISNRGNGFRVDHAFANDAFENRYGPISCEYGHGPRETKITDHSALIVECAAPSK